MPVLIFVFWVRNRKKVRFAQGSLSMAVITIREKATTDSDFTAVVSFDGQVEYPVSISDPFAERPNQEKELEWYFEGWLRMPMLDTTIAERAAASVATYGERLFQQVFKANADAYADYRGLRNQLSQVQIEIQGSSPAFQALHWEALKDPDLPRPFVVDAVMLRKDVRPKSSRVTMQPSPVINLLVVTARPDEEKDVGYRTISRPLIEAIQQAQLRVNVELLRPATFRALSEHLQEKGEGFYHIVHFDAHGGLMTHGQFQQGVERNRYLYQARYGRSDLQPYEGVKAFLFLEGDKAGEADPVEASELAELLTGKGVPVCILNACQSAKQEGPVETSLGSRLMAAGMQMVVAMGYSVTVTAAQILMEKLYAKLFEQKGMAEAMRLGRLELYNRKERRAYFNQMIDLEDWLLPVVYQNRTVELNLREFSPQEENAYYEALGRQFQFGVNFKGATYGFVGRDLEILKIERALLRHNVLLLRGMGGTGKTTLLNYLREWWQGTRFAQEIFYFGYDEKAFTLEQIVFAMGQQIYSPADMLSFQAMGLVAQVAKLSAKLKAEPFVLMLDNLESVTGQALAIQNTLPLAEQEKIRDFLARLVGGKTRVLLGSRSPEDWLKTVYGENVYPLRGLDQESRTVLAEKILARQVKDGGRIEQIRVDAEFGRLMTLLAGYPLAMEVVLANLARQSPAEVLAGLDGADVDLDGGSGAGAAAGGQDKTTSILKCVEYSHSNLSPEAQRLLLCLAPFRGFIFRDALPQYAAQLKQLDAFSDWDFGLLEGAVQEAMDWGLLSPISEETDRLLRIQPVFPYFLRTKLRELDEEVQAALREGFKNHCRGLAQSYFQLMTSKEAQERQLGIFFCRLEYENLYAALETCLTQQEEFSIFRCLDQFLDLSGDVQSRLVLCQLVCEQAGNYPAEQCLGERATDIAEALLKLGNCYYKAQQYETAQEAYQQSIEILKQSGNRQDSATVYHQLGIVAQQLREYEEARRNYQQALEIFVEFGDRYSQASTYGQLGTVALELREYDEARRNYQQALEIFVEFGDRYTQARTYHQLGRVAEELREYDEARRNYQQALEIFVEFGDRYTQASTYHQLGIVAEALREYDEARRNYQQALEIKVEFGDRYTQASTYHQLGSVAQKLREYDEARRNYQQALEIKVEFGDRYEQASTYGQLGLLAAAQENYTEAGRALLQALEIFAEFNDQHSVAQTIQNLNRLYQTTQDATLLTAAAQLLNTTPDELKAAPTPSAQTILTRTQGSWGQKTREEIDAQIAQQRQQDWGE